MKSHLLCIFFAVVACGCHHDVRLEFPEADGVGGMYDCSTTKGPEVCRKSTTVDPAEQNRFGTDFVIMPVECKKHFHRIVIHDADSSSPMVHVECAPPEAPIAPLTPITAAPAASGLPATTPSRP